MPTAEKSKTVTSYERLLISEVQSAPPGRMFLLVARSGGDDSPVWFDALPVIAVRTTTFFPLEQEHEPGFCPLRPRDRNEAENLAWTVGPPITRTDAIVLDDGYGLIAENELREWERLWFERIIIADWQPTEDRAQLGRIAMNVLHVEKARPGIHAELLIAGRGDTSQVIPVPVPAPSTPTPACTD